MTTRVYERIFSRWRPDPRYRPSSAAGAEGVRLRWLGTATFVVETPSTTLLIDPFVSRPSLLSVATSPLEPDAAAIARWLPARVDAVLCGHSHFDHLLDAALVAKRSGARIVGSRTTCAFAEASGVPADRITRVPPEGRTITVGDVEVRFVPSLHGRIFLGRIPADGEVTSPPRLPARAWHYRMGGAFGLWLRAGGVSIYHNGSADLIDAELDGAHADVLVCGLAGRRATRDYVKRLASALAPSVIVPTHHDAFFAPLEEGVRLLPGIDLDGFLREAREVAPRATRVTLDYDEALVVPPRDPRGAFLHAPAR